MSIGDLEATFAMPTSAVAGVGGGAGDERVPPQDMSAEQSVLGSMLLNKDAIAESLALVKGHDFYRPAHESIFEAILDLFGRGEPADAITVADELTKRGDLCRVGDLEVLHEPARHPSQIARCRHHTLLGERIPTLRCPG